jgi:hypothetical protein
MKNHLKSLLHKTIGVYFSFTCLRVAGACLNGDLAGFGSSSDSCVFILPRSVATQIKHSLIVEEKCTRSSFTE